MNTSISRARPDAPRNTRRQPLIAALLFALVLPLSIAAAGPSVLPGDVAIARLVQTNIPDSAGGIVAVLNSLGSAAMIVPLTLIVALAFASRRACGAALAVGISVAGFAANAILKHTFASSRPTTDLVSVSDPSAGYGFPSGHTMATTLLCGVLLGLTLSTMRPSRSRRWLVIGTIAMPLLMGISRIEVGAHWPSDVLGAYLWGAIATIGITSLQPRLDTLGTALGNRLALLVATRRPLVSQRRAGLLDARGSK